MKKREALSTFLLIIFLFGMINIPSSFSASLRRKFIFPVELFARGGVDEKEMELMQLKIENAELREQVEYVKGWLDDEERVETLLSKVEKILPGESLKPFYQRRKKEIANLLKETYYSVEARVIYRDPAYWSSGFWVDKGEKENRDLGKQIVAKNSPVLVGLSLVGVVETVEEERAYVRLITDDSLTPAVRAVRGGEQNIELGLKISALLSQLELREDVKQEEAISVLQRLKDTLSLEGPISYLAKGELRGSSYPLWRARSNTLKGIGFNYEFADSEGPARKLHMHHDTPIIAVGDLLVTSGLDGLFPPGLFVAIVSKIHPLKEGGFAFDLEAKATAENLEDLTTVSICPPIKENL
jgi:rod shape-determining protein MreC